VHAANSETERRKVQEIQEGAIRVCGDRRRKRIDAGDGAVLSAQWPSPFSATTQPGAADTTLAPVPLANATGRRGSAGRIAAGC